MKVPETYAAQSVSQKMSGPTEENRIILVSDDGSREEGRFAQFLILRPEQLRIAE